MKTLLLLRHAKSSWEHPGLTDHERPLNPRGIEAAARMGQLVADEAITPDAVWCSTALRAQHTWTLVRGALIERGQTPVEAVSVAGLYHCELDDFAPILRAVPDSAETLLVIGHNPGLADLLARLHGSAEDFPTATLALLTLRIEFWTEFSLDAAATLRRIWRPRELA